jgi:hypothetical protein
MESALKAWKYTVAAVVLTPLFVIAAILTVGGGHGGYSVTKLLFPYTMISTHFTGNITYPAMGVGLLQFLVYGLLLDRVSTRQVALGILGLHLMAVWLAFVYAHPSFTP